MIEDQPSRWPKILWGCLCIAILGAGLWLANPAYRSWKTRRYLNQAAEFLNQSDLKNAALSARQVLALSPTDADAARIMAKVTTELRSPELVAWRQRIYDLEPNNPTNAIELANSFMQFGDPERAEQALARLPLTNRNTAAFHNSAAMLKAAQGNLSQAEAHFAVALKLNPGDEQLQINHAVILLQAQDTNIVAKGIATLEKLSSDPLYRRMALQNLAQAYLRNNRSAEAISAAQKLATSSNATFGDQLLLLGVLRSANSPEFSDALHSIQNKAASTGPEEVQALATWLMTSGQAQKATQWLDSLPPDIASANRISMIQAELALQRRDWAALQRLTKSGDWGAADFLRHAYQAEACRQQQQVASADSAWLEANRAARGNPKALGALARLAADWHLTNQREELLWLLVERYPGEGWAAEELSELLIQAANTRGLNRLCTQLVSQSPENLAAKNNLAITSLLLGTQTSRATELAREVFSRYPSNESFASTYAFSLYQQGQREEALKAFSNLAPESLEKPSIAIYYGLILGTNAPAKATRYLDIASKGELLPEERTLLEKMRAQL